VTKRPYLVHCERHPHKETSHYCALHDALICEECDGHAEHAERHVSDLRQAEIERQLNEIYGELNKAKEEVEGMLGDIESYRQRQKQLAPKEVLEMFARAKKMTQKAIVLHPEHKNLILSDSQLVPEY
jgi:hypothetical protein